MESSHLPAVAILLFDFYINYRSTPSRRGCVEWAECLASGIAACSFLNIVNLQSLWEFQTYCCRCTPMPPVFLYSYF